MRHATPHDSPNVTKATIPPVLLNLDDAAAALSVCPRTLADLIAQGQIVTVRIGRRRLIRPTDLAAFADSLTDGGDA